MNMSDYEQYYQKGGTYVLPIEIFNELFGEMESWKKQSNQLQSNWNSLREFVTLKEKPKVFGAKNGKILELAIDLVFDMVLDKMNELEGKDRQ